MTGRRTDGFHVLDSIVCFPAICDTLTVEPAYDLSLAVEGPEAPMLDSPSDNLVLRAARMLVPEGEGARIRLYKALPVAAGIGGGSADAAAALRLLSQLWTISLPPPEAILALGTDVPVCLHSRPARMRGVGERLAPVLLPSFWIVLVNPRRPVRTREVFARLSRRDNPPVPELPTLPDARALAEWLTETRNDLQDAACALEPSIEEVLAALGTATGCRLARMSGSGATCFGLFESAAAALDGAGALGQVRPDWWIAAAPGQIESAGC